MIKKIKNSFNKIQWPNRSLVLKDLRLTIIGTIVLLGVMSLIEYLALLLIK